MYLKRIIVIDFSLRITAADTLRSGLAPSLGLKAHSPPSRFIAFAKSAPTLTPLQGSATDNVV